MELPKGRFVEMEGLDCTKIQSRRLSRESLKWKALRRSEVSKRRSEVTKRRGEVTKRRSEVNNRRSEGAKVLIEGAK